MKKAEKPERESALDGVPRVLPALMRAEALQKKARNVGFDWPDVRGSLDKVREEVEEVTAEIESNLALAAINEKSQPDHKSAEELGDLLFSIVNLTRHLKLDAEELLTGANDKFSRRFRAVEDRIKAQGKTLPDCTLEELDAAWNAVKNLIRHILDGNWRDRSERNAAQEAAAFRWASRSRRSAASD